MSTPFFYGWTNIRIHSQLQEKRKEKMQIAAARKIKWLKTTGIPKQTEKQEDPSSDYGEAV